MPGQIFLRGASTEGSACEKERGIGVEVILKKKVTGSAGGVLFLKKKFT